MVRQLSFFDKEGRPILIDPAIYFGNREAEFGMITFLEVLTLTSLRAI